MGGPLSQDERADRALAETYGRGVQRASGNRTSQILLVLALIATVTGVFVAGTAVGIGLLAFGVPTLVATTIWCLRNWEL
jgi:hypothetical protein